MNKNIENDMKKNDSLNKNDNVFHNPDQINPSYYTNKGISCIDAMRVVYGRYSVMDFCKCNAFKYMWRFEKKNGLEDLEKAQWYLNKLIELIKEPVENTNNDSTKTPL